MNTNETVYTINTLSRAHELAHGKSPEITKACEAKILELIATIKPDNTFTEEQLTSFGNYLLSPKRAESVSENNRGSVVGADVQNWKHLNQNK